MGTVIVDSSALLGWEQEMKSINDECADNIKTIKTAMDSLEGCFQGTYSEAFVSAFTSFSEAIQTSHKNLSEFSKFLDSIVDFMESR